MIRYYLTHLLIKERMKSNKLQKRWATKLPVVILAIFVANPANAVSIQLKSIIPSAGLKKQYNYSVVFNTGDPPVRVIPGGTITLSNMRQVSDQDVSSTATKRSNGSWSNNGFNKTSATWLAGNGTQPISKNWGTYSVISTADPDEIEWAINPFNGGTLTGTVRGPKAAPLLRAGDLEWNNRTNNFFEAVDPIPGNEFSVTFSPGNEAVVSSASGAFLPDFNPAPPLSIVNLTPAVANFRYADDQGSVGTNEFIYELVNNLDFNFDNGVSMSYSEGDQFLGSFNFTDGIATGVEFEEFGLAEGSLSIPSSPDAFLLAEELTFSDLAGGDFGGYEASIQAAVPEPITILGSFTALGFGALFKKKKLSSKTK